MVKIKGEKYDRCPLLPCRNTTRSGINVKYIFQRHLQLKGGQALTLGPAITDFKGKILHSNNIKEFLTEVLEEMFEEDSNIFPAKINTKEKIQESYHCFRTFWQSSNTQAINMGVKGDDIDVVNRREKR